MCYGLVAPGNAMATAVAAQMCGEAENAEFHEGSMDAKLKLMGIDHEQLTYRFQGRYHRLTDVHGNVVNEIIA